MTLNDNEKKVLHILEADPFVSQQYIADKLHLSRSAIANLISGLQDKGYILGKPYLLRKEEYITCVGGANSDYTFALEEEMIMGTSNPVKSSTSYGGVTRNVAENLARLNHQVSLMSVVGDDVVGEELLMNSNKLMGVFATEKIYGERTGSYYSVIGKDGNMNVGYADMSINLRMNRTWVIEHKKHLNMGTWIITDTNVAKDGIEALIEFSKLENKKLAIVGVSGPKMRNVPDNLDGVEIVICNLDESQSYFKTKTENLEELSKLWLERGVNKVVITANKNPLVYAENESIRYQKTITIPSTEIVDVTGAGDAFSAATINGLINQESFEKSIKYGIISSILTIKSKYSVNPDLSIDLIKKEFNKYEKL
ncbi:MAG: PfkB family carbohydrate kinase [Candidatus Izemoplasmatales bacterium]